MLLNRIPEVFCTNESDVAWLLYQVDRGSPEVTDEEIAMGAEYGLKPFTRHHLDIGSAGAVHTLRSIRHFDGEDAFFKGTWRARYEQIQHMEYLHIRQGLTKRPYGQAMRKSLLEKEWEDLLYVGDKMPTQVADPEVFNWWYSRFPETKFVHIVRDPRYVVASMQRLGYNTWWKEDIAGILTQWTEIEQWAIDIEHKLPNQVIRVYQEEMATNPDAVMTKIYSFLGIPKTQTFPAGHVSQSTPVDLPDDPLANEVIKEYGYV